MTEKEYKEIDALLEKKRNELQCLKEQIIADAQSLESFAQQVSNNVYSDYLTHAVKSYGEGIEHNHIKLMEISRSINMLRALKLVK